MLKTVTKSSNAKTGPIAVTYRAGQHATFATCPATCPLNPKPETSSAAIDVTYLRALSRAVPTNGHAWTYSHFHWSRLPRPQLGRTVINYSADSVADAIECVTAGRPAVLAGAPADSRDDWPRVLNNGRYPIREVRFLVCPEQLSPPGSGFTCQSCGNGVPLCAQPNRDYVIVFLAHGTGRKLAEDPNKPGGCYGASGPVAIQWHATRANGRPDDARAVLTFAASLPPGSLLRHHIAGDIGRAA